MLLTLHCTFFEPFCRPPTGLVSLSESVGLEKKQEDLELGGKGRGRVAGTREGGRAQQRYKRCGERGFDLLRDGNKTPSFLRVR